MNGAADAVRLSMMTAYPLARKCSVAAAPLSMTPSSDSQGKGTELNVEQDNQSVPIAATEVIQESYGVCLQRHCGSARSHQHDFPMSSMQLDERIDVCTAVQPNIQHIQVG